MAPELPALTGVLDTVVFRYSSYDSPLWARNNTGDGRWHRTGDGATQYLTVHPDGAWAELARAENLRTEHDVSLARVPIWALRLNQQNLVDYRSFDQAEATGLPPEALIDDNYTRCQDEGLRLRELGFAGVVAPSAALPGVLNVTIFGRRVVSMWGASTRLASSIPGCVVAVGTAPPGISARVRYVGEPHAGYQAYEDGKAGETRLETFRLEEPEEQQRSYGYLTEEEEEDDGSV